tara:strand:+ start:751 stop:1533 length:783 start_codon:yes stop_codon:yes gene_type:complete
MEMLNFIFDAASVKTGDFTGFTFFIGSVSMLAATVFFLMQHGQVDKKFKDSMLVAALITGIAAVHYFYMREQWVMSFNETFEATGVGVGSSPTELRYIDWILTVPLMVVEFALLTGVGMRKLFWASVVMLVAGYFGESGVTEMLDPAIWGGISGLAYFYMAYEVGCLTIFGGPSGEVGKALSSASGKIPSAGRMLQWFVLVGWAIYPLGYLMGTDGMGTDAAMWYEGISTIAIDMDVVYNVGDAVNKIGFGMAVWYAAKS